MVLGNITGGRFRHNTIHSQWVAFDAATLNGFTVGMNRLAGEGAIAPQPWITPAFQNAWGQQTNYTPAGYMKDENGWVHLRGGIYGGKAPNPVFTLPVGYRPPGIAVFATSSANGDCRISVTPGGVVTPEVAAQNNPCLDGISFYAGN